ncbi:MAG: hypothetical protein ACOC97_05970 [Myxococcota bacterium]
MNAQVRARPLVTQVAACIVVACHLCHSTPARADELSEFEEAREAYDRARYEEAVERFEALVGGDEPRLRSRPLVLESRKYLAASYLFTGHRNHAEGQLERLLRQDPDYQLDPVAFPRELHELFSSVQEQVEKERRREQRERQDRVQEELERQRRLEEQRQRITELERVARTEVVREENSRWVAMLPFGVGQFQNGHDRLGLALAISQGILAAGSVATFFLHRAVLASDTGGLFQECPRGREGAVGLCSRLERRERAYRVTNWVSTGLLAGLVAYGILDAQLRFVPHTETTRERELPPEVDLGVGAGSLHLRVTF